MNKTNYLRLYLTKTLSMILLLQNKTLQNMSAGRENICLTLTLSTLQTEFILLKSMLFKSMLDFKSTTQKSNAQKNLT
jgi:hypothetical protein